MTLFHSLHGWLSNIHHRLGSGRSPLAGGATLVWTALRGCAFLSGYLTVIETAFSNSACSRPTATQCQDVSNSQASQAAPVVKSLPANAGDVRDAGSIPGSGRSGGGYGNALQYSFLPGESHGQRSLVGYSPQGCKESDTTEPI